MGGQHAPRPRLRGGGQVTTREARKRLWACGYPVLECDWRPSARDVVWADTGKWTPRTWEAACGRSTTDPCPERAIGPTRAEALAELVARVEGKR